MNATALPREIHAGTLRIGSLELPCAVLDNQMRVISSTGFSNAFGQRKQELLPVEDNGVSQLPRFLAAKNLNPFVPADFAESHKLISYQPKQGGREARGYPAKALVDVSAFILRAHQAGVLRSTQEPLVEAATNNLTAIATVGIIALVDEACGYLPEPNAYRDALETSVQETLTRTIAKDRTEQILFERRITQELAELRQLVTGKRATRPAPAAPPSDLSTSILHALEPVSEGIHGRDLRRMLGAAYAPFYQALYALRAERKVIGLNPERNIEGQLYISAQYADVHRAKSWLTTKAMAQLVQVNLKVFNNWVLADPKLRQIANKEGNTLLWPTEETLAHWKENIETRLKPRDTALQAAVTAYVDGKMDLTTNEVRLVVAPDAEEKRMQMKIALILRKLGFEKTQGTTRETRGRYWTRRPMN